ncbi:SMI1/KNR4 family protein [Pectobacterium parmentieri]|uniref:SMI1/KNR4 family protein n=1 Tax=Pectobacterium parmentieri TaxID=1905730 RepID=UPI000EB52D75|nr:SMI1/KNR4 family protein [Pectobacterium parmentieri]AYH07716.1 SMI1/KNR4 family protein [Pectobacterium parmentieri]AYH25169.1 SMI1/KNR4 family protein [Pectobacterium parmentieri]MBN3177297.1 SMI1/KNR4 family protein [Pectobacterium parmentieri]QRN29805.1 SMI1/KNR4 family protein [Pectobacterium parmentieri]
MSNIKFFSDPNIKIKHSLNGLSEQTINSLLPYSFPGKDFFVDFYIAYNGGYLEGGAFYYRDVFYNIHDGDYNLMEVEGFNFIPQNIDDSSSHILSLIDVWRRRKKYSEEIKKFCLSHFPFAADAGDNDYWIDIKSGCVKYIRWENDDNPNNAVMISPSFYDFCINLKAERK